MVTTLKPSRINGFTSKIISKTTDYTLKLEDDTVLVDTTALAVNILFPISTSQIPLNKSFKIVFDNGNNNLILNGNGNNLRNINTGNNGKTATATYNPVYFRGSTFVYFWTGSYWQAM